MTTNLQLALQVAKHVQLRSVALKMAHIESYIEPDQDLEALSVSQQHRSGFEVKSKNDLREIHVIVEFNFRGSMGSHGETEMVKLDASFILVYTLPETATFESRCLQHFSELNGAYNAWPYWRELVQSATGRVGLGGILVPVYRPVSAQVADPELEACEPASS